MVDARSAAVCEPTPDTGSAAPVHVLVVDDSAIIRGLITRMIEAEKGFVVVGTAANGEQAIRELKRRPADVVILDIEMPVMDGLTAIPGLLQVDPRVKILIASTLSTRNAEISLRALQAGAADYLAKPTTGRGLGGTTDDGQDFRQELVRKVRALGDANLSRRIGRPKPAVVGTPKIVGITSRFEPSAAVLRNAPQTRPEILAIGSSTGGPQALLKLLRALGRDFPLPILITQHMPASFTAILAGHISNQTGLACAEARDGEQIVARRIYIAPGGVHMIVVREAIGPVIRLNDGPPENFCRPAVDPMFRSISKCYGARVLAAILTGMGSDGSKGGQAIVAGGGTVIAQDEESSVVWGMPGAAAAAGICSAILPLDQIAPWIQKSTASSPL